MRTYDRETNLITEFMEGSYEDLTIELRSEDDGLTKERREGKSGPPREHKFIKKSRHVA